MEKRYCQSCGMPIDNPQWRGTNADSSESKEYCYYCLKDGEYVVDVTMDEMIEIWMKYTDEFNRYSNSNLTREEVGALLRSHLPNLKRWRQKHETIDAYHKAINKVTDYINNHLFEQMDLKALSNVANLSEFHFHRIFRAIVNENVGEYIQRLRLEFVAHKLLATKLPLNEITDMTSYKSIYALSRAFKKHFGVPPTVYRNQAENVFTNDFEIKVDKLNISPRIVQIEDMKIVYTNIKDAYRNADRYKSVWDKLIGYIDKNKLASHNSKYVSMSFDDPVITSLDQCRFYIGMTTDLPIEPKGKYGVMSIPEGEYAVFRFKGEYLSMYKLYNDIYLRWLPDSGYQLRNTFSFEVYINTPREVNSSELLTDVYMPVEKAYPIPTETN